jgi:hypothetical protein
MAAGYINRGPTREDVDSSRGALVLEFGTDWCGFCHSAAPAVEEETAKKPGQTLGQHGTAGTSAGTPPQVRC